MTPRVFGNSSRDTPHQLTKLALRQKYQDHLFERKIQRAISNSAITRTVSACALGVSGRTPGLGMDE
jgi:hypothetical protein